MSGKCAGKICEPDDQGRPRACNPDTGRCKLIPAPVHGVNGSGPLCVGKICGPDDKGRARACNFTSGRCKLIETPARGKSTTPKKPAHVQTAEKTVVDIINAIAKTWMMPGNRPAAFAADEQTIIPGMKAGDILTSSFQSPFKHTTVIKTPTIKGYLDAVQKLGEDYYRESERSHLDHLSFDVVYLGQIKSLSNIKYQGKKLPFHWKAPLIAE